MVYLFALMFSKWTAYEVSIATLTNANITLDTAALNAPQRLAVMGTDAPFA